jgi:hypothetical protein
MNVISNFDIFPLNSPSDILSINYLTDSENSLLVWHQTYDKVTEILVIMSVSTFKTGYSYLYHGSILSY